MAEVNLGLVGLTGIGDVMDGSMIGEPVARSHERRRGGGHSRLPCEHEHNSCNKGCPFHDPNPLLLLVVSKFYAFIAQRTSVSASRVRLRRAPAG
jgi:hypothetical protein